MARPTPATARPAWLTDCNSFLVSAVCHLLALIALGLFTVAVGKSRQGIELLAHLSDGHDLPGDDAQLDAVVELETTAETDSTAAAPEHLFALAPIAVADAVSFDSLFSVSDVAGGLAGLGVGQTGDARGGRQASATSFFGIGGSGNSVVYVVDCSDSMNADYKFERARYELMQSIEHLSSDQRFFVIFYNDGAYPMDADQPVEATREQVDRTHRWVRRIVPGGGTNPLPALLYALSLEPDAIYFLSDGRFDPLAIVHLRVHNRSRSGKIPIHTIAFVNRETQGLMRTIARNSGGDFRFVP